MNNMNILLKKSLLIVFVVLLAVSVTACAAKTKEAENKTAAETKQTPKTNEPIKLRIMWWGAQARHDATLKALDLYTKKNPNVTFEPEYSGFDGYLDKLSTQAASKNAPDIIQMDAAWLADWTSRNQLADLSTGINMTDVDATLLNTGKYKDKLYAVPLGNNAIGYIYDKVALEKLGIAAPKPNWTWDDFFKLARDIKAKVGKDQYVMLDATRDNAMYSAYQLSKGKGWAVTPEGKFNVDKATLLEWLKIFEDFRKLGIVPPADMSVSDKEIDPKLDLMVTGKVFFRTVHAAQATSFDSLKPESYAMTPLPRAEQAGGWLKASMYWSISPDSKKIEESKKFIDWFVNDPEAADILGTTRGVPVSKKILSGLESKLTVPDKVGIDLINKVAPDAQTFNPGAKGWANYNAKDWKDVGEQIMFGKLAIDKAFDELAKKSKEYEK
jgi:multiple sugar transport system substrate-binding protein